MNTIPPYQFVNQPDQLAPLCRALDRVEEVAIDTEADNLFRYRTAICLLQVRAGEEIYLVDLLANLPLADVWTRIAAKHLLMHGSDYDLRLLHELCGFRPRSLFDTMFAAQHLAIPRFGLGALLEQHFGVKLNKGHQKANWSQRPLDRDMLDYAALDVHHLPALRDRLMAELQRLGRVAWVEQRCRWQIEVAREGFAGSDDNAWRIGGAEKLSGPGLTVLHAVWHWREAWAERLNTPPFKITGNELLLRLAHAASEGLPAAGILRVHLGRRHDRLFPTLADAVRRGLATDPATLPRRERRREAPSASPEEIARQERLRQVRDRLARDLALDPTLLATRSQLAAVARDPAAIGEVLLPWQAELLQSDPSWNT